MTQVLMPLVRSRVAPLMAAPEPITHWLRLAKAGDGDAARPLWEHFFQRLVGLARKRLHGTPCGDEGEDVALSVLESFFRRARQGAFPNLNDREDLWRLLALKTVRKAIDNLRRARARKRPEGHLLPVTDAELQQVIGHEPTPEQAAEFADSCKHLLAQLPADLRQIAVWRMEGCTVEEIADRIGRSERTVKRKLDLIRTQWGEEDEL